MTFQFINGAVCITGQGRPVRLSTESVEDLLTIFDREGAASAYNALHDAHINAGGIPRVSSQRTAA